MEINTQTKESNKLKDLKTSNDITKSNDKDSTNKHKINNLNNVYMNNQSIGATKRIVSKIITRRYNHSINEINICTSSNKENESMNYNLFPNHSFKYKNSQNINCLPRTNSYEYLSINEKNKYPINHSLTSSKSFIKSNTINTNHREKIKRTNSTNLESIKRKTINRGVEIKNVQITHIICSSKPSSFHITEKLSTFNLRQQKAGIPKTNKEKMINPGRSSFSSSCKDNVNKIQNLKGKTTIYQHARGIGMTNDRKNNINPLFYNSEIKKLEPIVKEKQKEKVEYINNFRSKIKNDKNNSNINDIKDNNDNKQNKNTNIECPAIIFIILFILMMKIL